MWSAECGIFLIHNQFFLAPFPVGEMDTHKVNTLGQSFEADGEAFGVMVFHAANQLPEEVADFHLADALAGDNHLVLSKHLKMRVVFDAETEHGDAGNATQKSLPMILCAAPESQDAKRANKKPVLNMPFMAAKIKKIGMRNSE